MERAPLPPHERTWRHPSEIGPTSVEVDGGANNRRAALTTGALAVALVAALVVTVTPRNSTGSPLAVSATTTPARESVRAAASTAIAAAETLRSVRLADAPAIPSAIADVPALAFRSAPSATAQAVLPDLDDPVLVITEQYTYSVSWSDVARLELDGDAMVVGADGAIVARFSDGRLVVSYDLLLGSATAED